MRGNKGMTGIACRSQLVCTKSGTACETCDNGEPVAIIAFVDTGVIVKNLACGTEKLPFYKVFNIEKAR